MSIEKELKQLREQQEQILARLNRIEEHLHLNDTRETFDNFPVIEDDVTIDEEKLYYQSFEPKRPPIPASFEKYEPFIKIPDFSEVKLSKIINRVGVVVLILGLAMFLKYSFDNQWIGPTGRILIGILSGLALWSGGEYTKTKYPVYSQGLTGGGSLAIFLSIYAGYDFYHLYSSVITFGSFIAVMALTVLLAIRQNSLAIGILGLIGGYAAPFLVGSTEPSPWTLFTYLSLLTMGVTGVSYYKKWTVFNFLSFGFNQSILIFWFFAGYYNQFKAPTLVFLITLFILYLGISSLYNIKNKIPSSRNDITLITLNAVAYFLWSIVILKTTVINDYLGFYALAIALIYVAVGKFGYTLNKEDKGHIFALFGIALVLTTIALPLQVKEHYLAIGWLTEGLVLVYTGFRLDKLPLRLSGLAVYGLGLFSAIDNVVLIDSSANFLLNIETLVMFFTLGVTGGIVLLYKKYCPQPEDQEKVLLTGVKALFLIEIFCILFLENSHFFISYEKFRSMEPINLSLVWVIYSLALLVCGFKYQNKYLRFSSLLVFAISLINLTGASYILLDQPLFFLNFPNLGIAALIGATVTFLVYYKNNPDKLAAEEGWFLTVFKVLSLIEIFAVISFQNHHFFKVYEFNSSAEQISLSFLWLIYGTVLLGFGFKNRNKYLRYAGLALLAVVLVKAFLVDLAFLATIYKIILFVIIGLVLLGVSLVYQKKQSYFTAEK